MILADISTNVNAPTSGWLLLLVVGSILTSVGTLFKSRSDSQKTRAETESIAQKTTADALVAYRAYADPLIAELRQQQADNTETIRKLNAEIALLRQRVERVENQSKGP